MSGYGWGWSTRLTGCVLIGSSHAAVLWFRQAGLSYFTWDQNVEDAFQHPKWVLVNLVQKGVVTFDKDQVTCFASDWSKDGMGFLLLQKHCPCTICLIFAGSRFCTYAERRWAPIESKAAVIAWVLEKCYTFVMGCPSIIVVTDHEPLKGLLGNREPSKIQNPWLFRLKEKSLRYRFTIQHCPRKCHTGSDAISRNSVAFLQAFINILPAQPSQSDILESDYICNMIE